MYPAPMWGRGTPCISCVQGLRTLQLTLCDTQESVNVVKAGGWWLVMLRS